MKQIGPKCYTCNKFEHIAIKCTSCWSDANTLEENIQKSPSINELFSQEEKDEYSFNLPRVDTVRVG